MMLKQLMTTLYHDLEIEKEENFNETTHYTLALKNHVTVEIFDFSPSHYLCKSIIGPLPEQEKNTVLLKTMEANLFGIGTKDAIIGLQEEENLLTVSLALDYNISHKEFKEKLEDFVSVVSFWQQQTQTIQ